MLGRIKDFDKKSYEILTTSKIKIRDKEEKMQIKNIIEQSITQLSDFEYEFFTDIINTKVAVSDDLKPAQSLALKLYFLTEEVKIRTDKYGIAKEVTNKKEIEEKWNKGKEILFPEEVIKESEILTTIKNDITQKIENKEDLLKFVTEPLMYDIFFGGYYFNQVNEVPKIKDNFVLDLNFPFKLKYEYSETDKEKEEVVVLISVIFDKYTIPFVKLQDIYEKLGETYESNNVFLEGSGNIKLDFNTGRLKEANLRIIGGLLGIFTNTQEIEIKNILEGERK